MKGEEGESSSIDQKPSGNGHSAESSPTLRSKLTHNSEPMIAPQGVFALPRGYKCTQLIPAGQFSNPTVSFPSLEISLVSHAAFCNGSRSAHLFPAHLTPDPPADSRHLVCFGFVPHSRDSAFLEPSSHDTTLSFSSYDDLETFLYGIL